MPVGTVERRRRSCYILPSDTAAALLTMKAKCGFGVNECQRMYMNVQPCGWRNKHTNNYIEMTYTKTYFHFQVLAPPKGVQVRVLSRAPKPL